MEYLNRSKKDNYIMCQNNIHGLIENIYSLDYSELNKPEEEIDIRILELCNKPNKILFINNNNGKSIIKEYFKKLDEKKYKNNKDDNKNNDSNYDKNNNKNKNKNEKKNDDIVLNNNNLNDNYNDNNTDNDSKHFLILLDPYIYIVFESNAFEFVIYFQTTVTAFAALLDFSDLGGKGILNEKSTIDGNKSKRSFKK